MTVVESRRPLVRSGGVQASSLDVAAGFDQLCHIPQANGLAAFLREVAGPSSPWRGPEFSITWGPAAPRGRVFVQTQLEAGEFREIADETSAALARLGIPNSRVAEELVRAIYGSPNSRSGARLGLGVECGAAGTAGLRLYLDLFTQGREKAVELRQQVLQLLDAADAFKASAGAWQRGDELPTGRILGVGFPRSGEPRIKAYLPARRFQPEAIFDAAGAAEPELRSVLEILGGDTEPLERSSTLWTFGFRAQDAAAQAGWKLDFQLADFAADDAAAQSKAEQIFARLRLDAAPYRAALQIALEGAASSDSQGVHQYLGVEYEPTARWRAAVYLRPASSGDVGVSRRARPGRRESSRRQAAIETGTEAMLRLLGDGPLWRDFACSIGPSDEWASAYVIARLREVPEAKPLVRPAAAQLAQRQRVDGGWGYNASVASDCDSTAWALLALEADELSPTALDRARALLLEHQAPSGGFCTYRQALQPKKKGLREDWFVPQPCVSAAAVAALLRLGADREDPAVQSGVRYLGAAPLESCWWPDEAYTRAAIAAALLEAGLAPTSFLSPGLSASAFSLATSLGLAVLLERRERAELAERLLDLQGPDGRWPSAPILRIPDDKPGLVTISADQNGSFATATAVWALARLRDQRE